MSEGDVLELQHLTSLFKNSPLPAAVTDGSLNVLWSNPPAKEALPCLRLQDAFSLLLDEKARAAAIRSLALGESLQMPTAGPISGTLILSFIPVMEKGALQFCIVCFPQRPEDSTFYNLNGSDLAAVSFSSLYRVPISTILSLLTPLSIRMDGDETAMEQLSLIGKSCMMMLRATSQLTEFSKFQNGSARLCLRYGDLLTFLKEFAADCGNLIRYTGIGLSFECEESSCFTCFDSKRIETVFLNLLLNSILYTRDGNHITVRLYKTGSYAQVLFRDRGAGIREEVLPHVFEPYVTDGVPRFSRSGLGLPLCKHIILQHGGTISIHSELHEGTTVSFSLPLTPQGDTEALDSDPADLPISDPTRGIRIALSEVLPYRVG